MIIELRKDIFRVCQKIKICLHFMYIAAIVCDARKTEIENILNFHGL
jgi:hypothetical protein